MTNQSRSGLSLIVMAGYVCTVTDTAGGSTVTRRNAEGDDTVKVTDIGDNVFGPYLHRNTIIVTPRVAGAVSAVSVISDGPVGSTAAINGGKAASVYP